MKRSHPSEEPLRRVVEVLAIGGGRIRERLHAAERHFREVSRDDMRGPVERDLVLRIGAGLVEGGDDDEGDDEDADLADCIAMLDESRAAEIAGDMLRLYEVVIGVRDGSKIF
jgi:hypothetical protein